MVTVCFLSGLSFRVINTLLSLSWLESLLLRNVLLLLPYVQLICCIRIGNVSGNEL